MAPDAATPAAKTRAKAPPAAKTTKTAKTVKTAKTAPEARVRRGNGQRGACREDRAAARKPAAKVAPKTTKK